MLNSQVFLEQGSYFVRAWGGGDLTMIYYVLCSSTKNSFYVEIYAPHKVSQFCIL